MKTILIPTIQDDIHSASVALVLKEMGHRPIRWFCQDLPEAAAASFFVGSGPERITLRDSRGTPVDLHGVDVLWNRRVGDPIIRDAAVDPSDGKVARNEVKRMVAGLMKTISARAFSVNDYQASVGSGNKLYQLHVAKDIGFEIPDTLISNDPAHVRDFLRRHEDTGTIFKSFQAVTWYSPESVAILYTHKVTPDMLPSDQMLQLSPGIFQAYIPKAFEVRVTCMGAELFAARLDSQHTHSGVVDWRLANLEGLPTTGLDLPEDVATRCRALLRRLGLVFGCFDFVVTPSGEYVFLEVNQMGQFLWIEEAVPEFPMLQAFCEFLLSGDPDFRYSRADKARFSFADVEPSALEMLRTDLTDHVIPNEFWQVVHEVEAPPQACREALATTSPAHPLGERAES